ncbi:MAG: amidohydrolase family protein [Pseudomonadota bacterium]|nr:amidohydrolase family protein [Pseudomonadota bacterium]
MKKHHCLFLLIIWSFIGVNIYANSWLGTHTDGNLTIRCGHLIDGAHDIVMTDRVISIVDGTINNIQKYNKEIKSDNEMLDLSDYFCLPGLIDTHTHITDRAGDTADLSIYFKMDMDEVKKTAERNALITLNAGFTTIRNVGAYIAWSARDIRDRINRGEVLGPRIQTAGFYLTVPGGGGDLLIPGIPEESIPDRVRQGVSRGPEQFRHNAEKAVQGGADVLKILASGAVLAFGGIPGAPEMTPEEIAAVVEVAHAAGIKVTAHAHGAQSIKEAILAGVDSIEHASLADEEAIQLAFEQQVAFSMDVYNGDYINAVGKEQGWPEEFLRKNIETVDAQRTVFSEALRIGVPIIYGTDAAVYPHGDNGKQFQIMVQHGMTPMQAIKSATSVSASYIGWTDKVGTVRPGLYGDLIAVRKSPLNDIRVLENVDVVIKGGVLIKGINN